MGWSVKKSDDNVHVVTVDSTSIDLLLISDLHWDNPHCDRTKLKEHLDEAKRKKALVATFGDFFCAMQGKYDKRSSKSSVRPEHQTETYLDSLVKTAAKWFQPYKDNLALLGYGNHETKILERHETDLLSNLADKLGGITTTGGYNGWIKLKFLRQNSFDIYYHHGFGGGGPVTKGAIDFNRFAEYVVADMIVAGHVHWKGSVPVVTTSLTDSGTKRLNNRYYLRLGTYKDEFSAKGFHVESGRGPRPLGGYWVRLSVGHAHAIKCEIREAI